MNSDLGVWTADDCALVLIDYQKEMFEVIRSETDADLVELHVRLLAKTAKAFEMPIVLTTVGVTAGFNGPTLPSILEELDGLEEIDRFSMNAFEDDAFRAAVEETGRKRLIIGGLHTEICLTFATVEALKNGYDVMYVTDAVGGRSQVAHSAASSGSRTQAPSRPPRSRSAPSCSATGPARSGSPPSTPSTGTSVKSRT
jgi:nicotinamidase-related amidase